VKLPSSIAVVTMAAFALVAKAGLSQSSITPPGGYVQTAAFPASNGCIGANRPGGDITAFCGLGVDFEEQAFSGTANASASSFNNAPGANGPINQSISGSAGLGFVRAQGSNSYTDFAPFANAVLGGGWSESFTVSHPGLNGQAGFMVFRLRARGTFQTQGLSGSAIVEISPYKNGVVLALNPYYNQEGSDSSNGAEQYARWGLASFGLPDSRNVDAYVTMSVPITFGTPFTLGVYVRAIGAQRSSGGFNGPSTGALNFSSRGVEWAGITSIRTSNGTILNGSTISSGSGIDWVPPLGACDSIDFNNDGSLFDPTDIDAFLSVFSEGPCIPANATCNDIDFNNDTSVFDPQDIDSFLSVFSEGPCL
jgi:hypothetical protein